MANQEIHEPKDYSEEIRKLLTTDPAHADTFNPLFERLINNDAFIKSLVERLIKEHDHSGAEGKGSKIPIANINVPAEMGGGLVTSKDLDSHTKTRNPHGTTAADVGAPTKEQFTEHLEEIASSTKPGHVKGGGNVLIGPDGKLETRTGSKTQSGVYQVGEGLNVSNGVLSANVFIDNTKSLDSAYSDFLTGETITIVPINASNLEYQKYTHLMNNLLNLDLDATARISFRYFMRTVRISSPQLSVRQTIEVFSNASTFGKVFEMSRMSIGSNEWSNWYVVAVALSGNGSPDSVVSALRGTLYQDILTGEMYYKSTGITNATNTGWVPIVNKASNWLSVTGQNGFLNTDAEYFKNSLREVHLRIYKKSSVGIPTDTILFQLPIGFRPAKQILMPLVTGFGANAYIQLLTDGIVKLIIPSSTSQETLSGYFVFKAVE